MKNILYDISININKSIPENIYEHFVNLILSGHIVPGQKLPSELELSRKMKISRIALREAMQLLTAKGYIDSFGRKGKFIKSISNDNFNSHFNDILDNNKKFISEMFETKKAIDSNIVEFVIKRVDKNQISNLNTFIDEANKEKDNYELRKELYHKYWSSFYMYSQNPFLSHISISLSKSIDTYMENYQFDNYQDIILGDKIFKHTEEIIELLNQKDISGCKSLTNKHLNYIQSKIT